MHDSYQAYGGGISIRDYVDMRFADQHDDVKEIKATLARIDGRVGVLEAWRYKEVGALGVIIVVGQYVVEKYL